MDTFHIFSMHESLHAHTVWLTYAREYKRSIQVRHVYLNTTCV